MSRVKNCIQMLHALENHQLLTKQQLAGILETNPRNIREYKRELEQAGIPIREKRGRHGGYYLAQSVLRSSREEEDSQTEKLEKIILECIRDQCGCSLHYSSGKVELLEPYGLVHFRSSPYVIGWQKAVQNWGFIRIHPDNIESIQKTAGFIPVESFILIDYLDAEPYFEHAFQKIILELDPLQEQSLLKNPPGDCFQKLESPERILYSFLSCDDLASWLMSRGYICLAPESLRQSIVKLLESQLSLYQS